MLFTGSENCKWYFINNKLNWPFSQKVRGTSLSLYIRRTLYVAWLLKVNDRWNFGAKSVRVVETWFKSKGLSVVCWKIILKQIAFIWESWIVKDFLWIFFIERWLSSNSRLVFRCESKSRELLIVIVCIEKKHFIIIILKEKKKVSQVVCAIKSNSPPNFLSV